MCDIFSGRREPCSDNIGGIKNIYLFGYIPYKKYQISQDGTTLLKFPDTLVYKYELMADANNFTSTFQTSPDGDFYDQQLSIVLKVLRYDAVEIYGLLDKRIGCIIETRLGQYQIMGLYNGCRVKSVKGTTGGARNSFNGYNLTIEAKSEYQPFFIENLEDAGFEVVTPGDALLQETGDYLLQENGFKILL